MDNLPNRRTYSNNLNNIFPDDNTGESLRTGVSLKESYLNKELLVATESVENSDLNNIIYNADLASGYIGYNDISIDNPEDNVFHFTIGKLPNKTDQVLLKYDLFGASSSSCLARSINSRAATGGNIAKMSNSWTSVSEEISADWLKSGDNTIVFTINQLAAFNCQVKNMRLEVRSGMQENRIVFTDKSLITSDGKLYVKGFVQDANENNSLVIDNIKLEILDGEFEDYIPIDVNAKKISLNAKLYENDKIKEVQTLQIKNKLIADFNTPIVKSLNNFSGQAKPEYNFHLDFEKSFINIPPNALTQETEITVSKLRRIDLAPLNPGIINVTKGGTGYRFTPDGIQFKDAVTLSLEYDSTLIPRGHTAVDIQTFYFNTNTKRWETVEIDSIDKHNQRIISSTTHFTDYINGIIQVPEGPQSNAFAPTMMNDIKAADPAANITFINPPVASQTGEASVSYPIKIPSGRKGMQPNLVLQYNSEGGSGWLGQGWSINLPAITLDTRWGVPTFGDKNGDGLIKSIPEVNLEENEIETEIYLLNGEQLMYPKYKETDWMPNRHYDVGTAISTEERPKISNAIFTLRKQGGFEKIERLGSSPKDYYWKVTTTDGTINWYGAKSATDFENGTAAVIFNSNGFIVHWALVQTIDVHGNNINYSYNKGTYTGTTENSNLNAGTYFYPKKITYTGKNNYDGQYSIFFNRKETSEKQLITRADAVINGRLGLKQVDPFLLGDITIKFQSSVVRSYSFDYITSKAFNKTLLNTVKETDGDGNEFYHHQLEYYDDVSENGYYSNGEEISIDVEKCYLADFNVPAVSSFVPYYHYTFEYFKEIPLEYCSDKTRAKLSEIKINQGTPSFPTTDLYLTHQPSPSCPQIPVISEILDPITQNENFGIDCNTFLNSALASLVPREIHIDNKSGIYRNESNQVVNVNHVIISFESDIEATISYKIECPIYPAYDVIDNFIKTTEHYYTCVPVKIFIKSSANTVPEEIGTYPDLSDPINLHAFEADLNERYGGYPPPNVSLQGESDFRIVIPNTQLIFESITTQTSQPQGSNTSNFQSCGGSGTNSNAYSNTFFPFPLVTPTFNSNASLLGSTKSTSGGGGFYLGGGVGYDPTAKTTTIGTQLSGGLSKSEGFLTMADIDGDGLDDIILKVGEKISYRKHIVTRGYDDHGEMIINHNFLDSREVLGDVNNFYCEKGANGSINVQVTYGAQEATGFAGVDWSGSTGETNIFFTDANADGLIDIAKNGSVYFNRIDNGLPRFESGSENTENMILTAEAKLIDTPPLTASTQQTFPACDVVKVWEAPRDGAIEIKNDIYLKDVSKQSQVTIEMNNYTISSKCYTSEFPVRLSTPTYYYYYEFWEQSVSNYGILDYCPFPEKISSIYYIKRNNIIQKPVIDSLSIVHYDNNVLINKCPNRILPYLYQYDSIQNFNFVADAGNFIGTSIFSNDPVYMFPSANNVSHLFNWGDCIGYQRFATLKYYNYYLHNDDRIAFKTINNNNTPFTYDVDVLEPDIEHSGMFYTDPQYYIQIFLVNDPLPYNLGPFRFWDESELIESAIEEIFQGTEVSITKYFLFGHEYGEFTMTINNSAYEFEQIRIYRTDIPPSDDTYDFHLCNEPKNNYHIPVRDTIVTNKEQVLNIELLLKNDSSSPYKLNFKGNRKIWKNNSGTIISDPLNISYLESKLPKNVESLYEDFKKESNKIKLNDKLYLDSLNLASFKSNTHEVKKREKKNYQPEENGKMCLLYGTILNNNNPESHVNIITNTCNENNPLSVKKGDKIYFRVHNVENGNSPIQWDPEITYTNPVLSAIVDENNVPQCNAKYSDGFILSKNTEYFPPTDATINIRWSPPLHVENLSDDVTFETFSRVWAEGVEKPIEIPLSKHTIPAGTTEYFSAPLTSHVLSNKYSIGVRVFSKSNVDWNKINWKPKMTISYTMQVQNAEGIVEGEIPIENSSYPVVDYSIYKSFPGSVPYVKYNMNTIQGNTKHLKLAQLCDFGYSPTDDGYVFFVVKGNNSLLGSRDIKITNGSCSYDDSPILIPSSVDEIEIGFYTDDSYKDFTQSLMRHLLNSENPLVTLVVDQQEYSISNDQINLMHKPDPLFGPMHRNWGQFFYNPVAAGEGIHLGNGLSGSFLKPELFFLSETQGRAMNDQIADLHLEEFDNINLNENPEAAILEITNKINDINQEVQKVPFVMATPVKKVENGQFIEKWNGLQEQNFATKYLSKAAGFAEVNNAYFNPDDEIVQSVIATGAYSISRTTEGGGTNVSGGLNIGGLGRSATVSLDINSKTLTDYVDYNGDRYPDILDNSNIQPTNKTGGLGIKIPKDGTTISGDISYSSGDSDGVGASGSFPSGGQSATGAGGAQTAGKFSFKNPFIGKPVLQPNNGNSSIGIHGEYSTSDIDTKTHWADINGDGINDKLFVVDDHVEVHLSYGNNKYDTFEYWYKGTLEKNHSSDVGGGCGISLKGGSIEAGVSVNTSQSTLFQTMVDVNNDGLLDIIQTGEDGNLTALINDGNSFGSQITNFPLNLTKSSESVSASVNATGSFAWITPIFGFPLKFPCISLSGRVGYATNRILKSFTDYDGDGYPDITEYVDENTINVWYSNIKRTNKLKTVTNSLGGSFTIDYRVAEKTYDNPNSKWNMYSVTVENGDKLPDNGPDKQIKTFEYLNGRYDRRERDFYGYETVKTFDHNIKEDGTLGDVYRTQENNYHNRNYYLKGLIKESKIYKEKNPSSWFKNEINTYIIKRLTSDNQEIDINLGNEPEDYDVGGTEGRRTACVLLSATEIRISDGNNQIFSKSEIQYDGKGRVIRFDKFKDNSTSDVEYSTEIKYHSIQSLTDKNIISIPSEITVVGKNGNVLRNRIIPVEGVDIIYGDITKINAMIDDVNFAVTEMEYESTYGNLTKITLPPNEKGQRMFYQYDYDTYSHKNIVSITDAFGYLSQYTYDNWFDVVKTQTDITGMSINYHYDNFGRLEKVIGPNEQLSGAPYTILFQYCPSGDGFIKIFGKDVVSEKFMPLAVTHHYDPQHTLPSDPTKNILTYTFSDGFGKPVQVKKDVVINTNTNRLGNPSYVEGLSVSGLGVYDFVGRVVNQHQQVFEIENGVENAYPNPNKSTYYKTTDYDFIDRVVKIKDEGDGVTDYTHNIEFGLLKLHTESDQDGTVRVISEIYKDLSDHVIKSVSIGNNNEKLITNFLYNEIGELKSYTDPGLLTSSYTYDQLGRKKTFNHPDNGLTTYKYDRAGNLISLQTANLATTDKWIKYIYDYNRLTKEEYPDNGTPNISNTTYIYGSVGSGTKTGRLIEQTDATGKQYFDYGLMGEMIYNERIVITPTLKPMTFITKFSYDSWNRINKITYPGNEEVSYSYDKGGNLYSIKGKIGSSDVFYIYRMDYDYFEQKTFAQYGVLGSQTVGSTIELYDYEPKLHRLSKIQVAKQKSSGHDFFINPAFTYDKLGNVKSITNTQPPIPLSGTYICGQYSHAYSYDSYNRLSSAQGQLNKTSGISGILKSEYNLELVDYYPSGEIWHKNQTHSINNVTYNTNTYKGTYLLKSNSHQISTVTNSINNNVERFEYDRNGNLVTRSGGPNEQILSWDEQNRLSQLQVDRNLFQYFYDATGERIVKVIGNVTKTFTNHDLQNSDLLVNGTVTYPSGYIVTELNQTYTKHYYNGSQRIASRTGDGTSAQFEKTTDDLNGLEARQKASILQNATATGINEVRYEPFDPASKDELDDDSLRAAGVVSIYYYHSDHLGTNTLITDMSGNPSQFFLNLPFGETMAEKIITSQAYSSPYKFNGKELDEGTGMYYYGARYYDPRISVWVSVDPLAEKYPSVSPYVYCLNNPIILIDPDGKDIVILLAKDGAGGYGHMGAVIQDGNGKFYYMTVGNADPDAGTSQLLSSGTQGGMKLQALNAKNINEAVRLAKEDYENKPYTDQVQFHTSSSQDKAIYAKAQELQKSINSGETEYNALTNNCGDAVETVFENGTGLDLPTGNSPKPIEMFKNIEENAGSVQTKIDLKRGKAKFINVPSTMDNIPAKQQLIYDFE